MLSLDNKRGKTGERLERGSNLVVSFIISLEAQRTQMKESCRLKWSVAKKWICVEIARRTLASSISGQYAKRLETHGHF